MNSPQTSSSGDLSLPFDLSAAIVTYANPIPQLRRAIDSLTRSTVRVHLVLVDNAGEAAVQQLAAEAGASYIRPQENVGFGKAHNLAYAQVRQLSPYHLVLNPDVHFDGPVLEVLLATMQARAELGVIMPKILYADGSTQFLCKRLPKPSDLVLRRFAPSFARRLFRRSMDRYELRDCNYDMPMEPPSLSGCFLLLRNAVIEQTGLFDERFFMYMEDVDLVRRIQRFARTLYYPSVSIFHEYQKGSYRSSLLASHHIRSAWKYFWKWGWLADSERDRLNRSV